MLSNWVGEYPPITATRTYSGIEINNVGALVGSTYYEAIIDGDNGDTTVNIFDNLYFGIDAENSNFTSTNNAFQHITGTATYSDGMGIKAHNTNTPFTSENRIKVIGGTDTKNNYFYDCKIGIDLYNYDKTEIKDINVRSDHGLLEGYLGIRMQSCQSSYLVIEDNTITNTLFGIHFTALNEYFNSYYPNAYNFTNTFDIVGNIIQGNLGGYTGTLTNEIVSVGIVVNNTIPYSASNTFNLNNCAPLNVSNNFLYNVRNGIELKNWLYYYFKESSSCVGNRPTIQHNYISLVDPGTGNSQFGINTEYNWNGIIKENYVEGFSNDEANYWGIRCASNLMVSDDAAHGQIVNCNYVDSTGIGVEFQDDQNFTTFENNTMDGSQLGFVLNAGIIGQQGNQPNYANKNKWPASSYASGQYKTYTVGTFDPTTSTFIITNAADEDPQDQGLITYNSGNPGGSSYIYDLGHGLTYLTSSNTNDDCEDYATPNSSNKSLSFGGGFVSSHEDETSDMIKWLEVLVQDSVPYAEYATERHINNCFRVYNMLSVNPSLMDSSLVLHHFFNAAQSGHIGALANAGKNIAVGQAVALSPNNAIETNYINYYNVYSHYRDSIFSVADSMMLKSLVEGCPVRDGMAVSYARTLYSILYGDYTVYNDHCFNGNTYKSISNTNSIVENTKDLAMEIYPNPNKGSFNIYLNGSNTVSETVVLSIYNLLGNKVGTFSLHLDNNIANFISGLDNGIYFITVEDVDGNAYPSKRIVVIK